MPHKQDSQSKSGLGDNRYSTVQAFLKGSSLIPESRRNERFRDAAEAVTRVT